LWFPITGTVLQYGISSKTPTLSVEACPRKGLLVGCVVPLARPKLLFGLPLVAGHPAAV